MPGLKFVAKPDGRSSSSPARVRRTTLPRFGRAHAPSIRAARSTRARAVDPSGTIEFTGFADREAKNALFKRAGAFVLPSIHENFGIAALEAVAHGIPVAASDGVQLGPFIAAHGLGAIFQQRPDALADAVVSVLSPAARARAATDGPARVRERFAPEIVGRDLAAMYDLAIQNRSVR